MDSINFVFWLQGLFELSDVKTLNETQVQIIKEHLTLVFTGVTPTHIEPQKSAGTQVDVTVTGSTGTAVIKPVAEPVNPLAGITSEQVKKAIEESQKAWDERMRRWGGSGGLGTYPGLGVTC